MKREDLKNLGLTDEQINAVMEQNGKDIEKAKKPYGDYEVIKNQLETAKKEIADKDAKITELSKVDPSKLQDEIKKLQDENKTAKENFNKQLKEINENNALSKNLNDKVHDIDYVVSKLDRDKLIFKEDGTVLGLDEQLTNLKEAHAFVFKEQKTEPQPKPSFNPSKGNEPGEISLGEQMAKSTTGGSNQGYNPWA